MALRKSGVSHFDYAIVLDPPYTPKQRENIRKNLALSLGADLVEAFPGKEATP